MMGSNRVMKRVEFLGGPLDGAIEEHPVPPPRMFWIGPSPTNPEEECIVYRFELNGKPEWTLVFDPDASVRMSPDWARSRMRNMGE